MNTIPRFHDATLETCTVHWEEGKISVRLGTGMDGARSVILTAEGMTDFACPHRLPWGPSDSVNEVRVTATAEGRCLEIEMQSGDVLRLSCRTLSWS